MDIAGFTDQKTGKLVLLPKSRPDASHAFIPDPLPPEWTWSGKDLWQMLIEARSCLSSLDGTGKHLPNPQILLRPLQMREARLSSKLEGTITNPERQALFQADPRYPTSRSDPLNAYREVFNYGRALQTSDKESGLPLSKRLIRQLHSILMDGVRGEESQPGEFRTIQVQINDPARFVPPPPERVEALLDNLERYLHSEAEVDPLVRSFVAHYQFEAIHPFRDRNGRVGRLLLAITIAEWCDLASQWLHMSAFFERNRQRYMDLLFGVSTHGDWRQWIQFCLEGVISQAKDTEKRCEKLLKLHRHFHECLSDGSVRLSTIVDKLFDVPIVTVTRMAKELNVTYPTARSDLRKLETRGILHPLEGMPTITYYCRPIFNITHTDAIDDVAIGA